MSFDLGDALEEGLARTVTRIGVILLVAYALLQLASSLVSQSLFRTVFLEYVDWQAFFADVEDAPVDEFRSQLESQFPIAPIDVPVEWLLALLVTMWLAQVVFRIGAIRWFVAGPPTRLTGDLFTRRLGWTVLNLIVGFVIYAVAVTVGLILLVIPGIFLAVALFFYNYEIIVEGKNAVDALAGSWELTAGNRLALFALGLIFAVVGGIAGSFSNPGAILSPTLSLLVGTIVTSIIAIAGIAVASVAYTQLRAERDAESIDEGTPA